MLDISCLPITHTILQYKKEYSDELLAQTPLRKGENQSEKRVKCKLKNTLAKQYPAVKP